MSFDAKRLYGLLPAIYRARDAERGGPLQALLAVIAGEVAVLEENLEQLYDDQFIETCAEWVVPYIGDLVGCRPLNGISPGVASPRAEVAHTIGYRRRKGTAAVLEQLARDVTGWPARVVEFFQLTAATQHMNHARGDAPGAPDLREWESLERLGGAFERTPRTAEVRRVASVLGKYNVPNLGIYLWRLLACPLTSSTAFRVDDRRYRFSPLGNDAALFSRPEPEREITHLAEPVNVPAPISRRVLDQYPSSYYGRHKSLLLNIGGRDIEARDILVSDLSDKQDGGWAHLPPDGKYAIDPVLGRIALPANLAVPGAVGVTFHSGFSAEMGGGEYERASSLDTSLKPVEQVAAPAHIQEALDKCRTGGTVEIRDSGRYEETLSIQVDAGQKLELRAANEYRPTVVTGDLVISGGAGAEVTLNGLVITGGAVRVPAGGDNLLRRLRLRHCTLVPGLGLTGDGLPAQPGQPSLIIEPDGVSVEIESSIVGALRVAGDSSVTIADSILDATGETEVAYAGFGEKAGGTLEVSKTTLIGKVYTVSLKLVSNSIVLASLAEDDTWKVPVRSERKQTGCVRFSFLPWSSVVPRRYRCQPRSADEEARLRPQFYSMRYGDPRYCQLSGWTAQEILSGADDEAEMGAFHDLYQPQRETNLRLRLEEYLRLGLEVGVFYAT